MEELRKQFEKETGLEKPTVCGDISNYSKFKETTFFWWVKYAEWLEIKLKEKGE